MNITKLALIALISTSLIGCNEIKQVERQLTGVVSDLQVKSIKVDKKLICNKDADLLLSLTGNFLVKQIKNKVVCK